MIGIAVNQFAKFSEHFMHFRLIVGVLVLNVAVAERVVTGKIRIIAQLRVFEEPGNGIHAEP